MAMSLKGLSKVIEECGELLQVAGKRLAYWHTDDHPDQGKPLPLRMVDEMGDVQAAIWFHSMKMGVADAVDQRAREKFFLFVEWDVKPDNNQHSVERNQDGSSESV